jgi:hypothetical protein
MYKSTVQVSRLQPSLQVGGGMSLAWSQLSDIVDPTLDEPGLLKCLLNIGLVRPGRDQPAPFVAGRAPDRVGVVFYDCAADAVTGIPFVKAGDRLQCVLGPVYGIWEIRMIPDVEQDYLGAHHMEAQVIEVSQALQPGSITPFPGGAP